MYEGKQCFFCRIINKQPEYDHFPDFFLCPYCNRYSCYWCASSFEESKWMNMNILKEIIRCPECKRVLETIL